MLVRLSFIILISNAAIAGEPICKNWKNSIAPDMQITESQLTEAALIKAAEYLSKHTNTAKTEFGVVNSEKIVKGFPLKDQLKTAAVKKSRHSALGLPKKVSGMISAQQNSQLRSAGRRLVNR